MHIYIYTYTLYVQCVCYIYYIIKKNPEPMYIYMYMGFRGFKSCAQIYLSLLTSSCCVVHRSSMQASRLITSLLALCYKAVRPDLNSA